MTYAVQLADARHARDQLVSLWQDNLTVEGSLDDKLQWFYCDGPHGAGQAFLLQTKGSEVIGSAGIGARALRAHGVPVRAALFADLAVARSHRSGFPALALVRAVKQHAVERYDVGYGFPNGKAEAVYLRAGYVKLGDLRRYTRVLRARGYLARRFGASLATTVGGYAIDAARSAISRLRAHLDRECQLVWVDTFDARFDALAQRSHLAPIACDRTAALLGWRFAAQPGRKYRIATLVRHGELQAYAVVRDAGSFVELADLYGGELGDVDALLRQLIPALYARGHDAVTMRFLGMPALPALLARHGFVPRDDRRMVAIVVSPRRQDAWALRDPGSWYLTDLDEDC